MLVFVKLNKEQFRWKVIKNFKPYFWMKDQSVLWFVSARLCAVNVKWSHGVLPKICVIVEVCYKTKLKLYIKKECENMAGIILGPLHHRGRVPALLSKGHPILNPLLWCQTWQILLNWGQKIFLPIQLKIHQPTRSFYGTGGGEMYYIPIQLYLYTGNTSYGNACLSTFNS